MQKKNSNVAFRRINGRIIPIKLTTQQKDRLVGTAAVAAGVGTALTGGQLYKKAVVSSAKAAFKGFNALDNVLAPKGQLSLFDINKANKYSKIANESLRAASKLSSFSTVVKKVAPLVGESLIAYGAFKFIKSLDKKTKKKINPELVYGGAAATTLLGGKAIELGQKAFEAGMYGKQGTFEFAKSGGVSIAQKLKDLAFKAVKAKF